MDMVCSAFDPVLSPPPACNNGRQPTLQAVNCFMDGSCWPPSADALKGGARAGAGGGVKLRGALNNKTGYFGVTHIPHTSKFKPYQARVWPAGWQA